MDKKILSYDIEVSYILGAAWELYDTNIVKVLREPYIMSIAWKWLGEDEVHVKTLPDFEEYKSMPHSDRAISAFIRDELFNKADVLIAHNGNSFDYKWCMGRFAIAGLPPPAPSSNIDTMRVAKKNFKLPSYSLSSLGKYFGLGDKLSTGGIDLWENCIEYQDVGAWKKMADYNKQDVVLLEKVYLKLRPYITDHPNLNLLSGTTKNCPNCGSANVQKRGFFHTRISKRQRYQCTNCAAWSSGEVISQEETPLR